MNRTILFVFVTCLFISCNKPSKKFKDVAIARVYDKYLYYSDIEGVLPKGLLPKDSLAFVNNLPGKFITPNPGELVEIRNGECLFPVDCTPIHLKSAVMNFKN